jgi:hypothetical protein
MSRAALVVVMAACGSSTGGDAAPVDVAEDAAAEGAAAGDASADGATVPDAGGQGDAAPASPRILFQCTPFDGGLCVMGADGTGIDTLRDDGFAPRGLDDGTVLFHSAEYHVLRRHSDGRVDDLGAGAFARVRPGGDLLFQCDALQGGLCTMDLDGRRRTPLRTSGRVPDVAGDGAILFHSDAYRVIRRDPDGREHDLGDGAFAVWTGAGDIVFQCSGLGGGLCRMNRDGSARTPLATAGRVPHIDGGGDIVFHTDGYRIAVRRASGTATLRAGANAVWW